MSRAIERIALGVNQVAMLRRLAQAGTTAGYVPHSPHGTHAVQLASLERRGLALQRAGGSWVLTQAGETWNEAHPDPDAPTVASPGRDWETDLQVIDQAVTGASEFIADCPASDQAWRTKQALGAATQAMKRLRRAFDKATEAFEEIRAGARNNVELGAQGKGYWEDVRDQADDALRALAGEPK